MRKINVVCINNVSSVLKKIVDTLGVFSQEIEVFECFEKQDAFAIMESLYDEQRNTNTVGLLIVSDLLFQTGVSEFFEEIYWDVRYHETKTLLLLKDTPLLQVDDALKNFKIHAFLDRSFNPQVFLKNVRQLLTRYLIDSEQSLAPYKQIIDKDCFDSFKKT